MTRTLPAALGKTASMYRWRLRANCSSTGRHASWFVAKKYVVDNEPCLNNSQDANGDCVKEELCLKGMDRC